jgi:hypothetical protein
METILWVVASFITALAIGSAFGSTQQASYWAQHAGKGPVCHDGEFYFVVIESKYIDLINKARSPDE